MHNSFGHCNCIIFFCGSCGCTTFTRWWWHPNKEIYFLTGAVKLEVAKTKSCHFFFCAKKVKQKWRFQLFHPTSPIFPWSFLQKSADEKSLSPRRCAPGARALSRPVLEPTVRSAQRLSKLSLDASVFLYDMIYIYIYILIYWYIDMIW